MKSKIVALVLVLGSAIAGCYTDPYYAPPPRTVIVHTQTRWSYVPPQWVWDGYRWQYRQGHYVRVS